MSPSSRLSQFWFGSFLADFVDCHRNARFIRRFEACDSFSILSLVLTWSRLTALCRVKRSAYVALDSLITALDGRFATALRFFSHDKSFMLVEDLEVFVATSTLNGNSAEPHFTRWLDRSWDERAHMQAGRICRHRRLFPHKLCRTSLLLEMVSSRNLEGARCSHGHCTVLPGIWSFASFRIHPTPVHRWHTDVVEARGRTRACPEC